MVVHCPRRLHGAAARQPFSALSVEPYGGSVVDVGNVCDRRSFSALSVEPYGGSMATWAGWLIAGVVFQCSLCRAVWWFFEGADLAEVLHDPFSALSVEPYGGSSDSDRIVPMEIQDFQCSLCRAVWWFAAGLDTRSTISPFSALSVEPYGGSTESEDADVAEDGSFSALSVEPYGGSPFPGTAMFVQDTFSALSVEPYGGSPRGTPLPIEAYFFFQCSLCRAVWWFTTRRRRSG